jgi:hypothetical protein
LEVRRICELLVDQSLSRRVAVAAGHRHPNILARRMDVRSRLGARGLFLGGVPTIPPTWVRPGAWPEGCAGPAATRARAFLRPSRARFGSAAEGSSLDFLGRLAYLTCL